MEATESVALLDQRKKRGGAAAVNIGDGSDTAKQAGQAAGCGLTQHSAAKNNRPFRRFAKSLHGIFQICKRYAGLLLELIHADIAPAVIVLGGRDAILPVGALVARQMGWPTPPIAVMEDPPFQTGDVLRIRGDGTIEAGFET